MKTDRELLELAAKAAENDAHYDIEYQCMVIKVDCKAGYNYERWNPLEDDGDALRLAIKLNLHVEIDAESAGTIVIEWDFGEGTTARGFIEESAPIGGDDYAATRRAIVRAAAVIAESNQIAPAH